MRVYEVTQSDNARMKVKRYKHARKVLSFYKHTFGVHEPYQVLGELYDECTNVARVVTF